MRAVILLAICGALVSGCVRAEKEGDFSIELPKPQSIARPDDVRELVTLHIRLEADDDGELSCIFLDGERLVVDADDVDVFSLLHRRVRQLVERENAVQEMPREFEAVIDADHELNFAVVTEAISAVSRTVDANGNIRSLVQNIKFAPRSGTAPSSTQPQKVRQGAQ